MTPVLLTRQEARAVGEKSYFTGRACLRGHVEVRSTANGVCYQCRRDSQNRYRAENIEIDRANSRAWYADNKEKAAQRKKNWLALNSEKYKARRKNYRSRNEIRAREMFTTSRWNAKKKDIPFDLDYEWIFTRLEFGMCELTGIKFDLVPLEGGLQNPYTASLDRIVPKLGYTKTNVRLILWALNAGFNTYGEKVYADIARVYLAKNGSGLT